MSERICSVEGCSNRHRARGYCNKHYMLVRRGGEPGRDRRTERTGERNHMWSDEPGYQAAHLRIKAQRGAAKDYACVDCGGPAEHWSYVGGCDAEMVGSNGHYDLPYCPHPEHYSPRCVSDHKRFDAA